ncbi:MAG TPA: hypothetical protein VJC39_03075 [Candidatus Nanoarchaeia archaeon]|nr:hypothetical protein [Candidatus Nanoarchaeia archaeon]
MVKEAVAVHKCVDRSIYLQANNGDILLFYSTRPMLVDNDCTTTSFAGEYFVPADMATELYNSINAGHDPSRIVKELGLERRTVSSVLEDIARRDGGTSPAPNVTRDGGTPPAPNIPDTYHRGAAGLHAIVDDFGIGTPVPLRYFDNGRDRRLSVKRIRLKPGPGGLVPYVDDD